MTAPSVDEAAAAAARQEKADAEARAAAEAEAKAAAAAARKTGGKPADSGRPKRGAVVSYRHRDVVTGDTLEGVGVVISNSDEGALTVAPLSSLFLEVDPDAAELVAIDVDDEDGASA